ncbi:membrane dipeptidase [Paenalkalicoccus suaedae]|uniref:Membrane dipeptidase n=1 Tax=Paenalkalicoccus suaedae TaxID=2592382 RepID=A0A859FF02_9BACI|nr:dipeptidase [Paenalkalicoccus suaedae]QKS71164.1 membrane dipeptidase [Paenalkalicoccus suaedae]
MNVIDLHCDALLRLDELSDASFIDDERLEVNLNRLKQGKVKVQFFAIFIEPDIPSDQKFYEALKQADLFHKHVLTAPGIRFITSWDQINQLKEDEIGAVLTLEGADPIGQDLVKLSTLYHLGVRSFGLTWNQANLVADGIGEPRGGGLTEFGFDVVKFNNEHRMLTDVSHLSIAGFYDVMKTAAYPIATHSNATSINPHRRNLNDEQIDTLIKAKGIIGIVYNPPFVGKSDDTASIEELIEHIDYILNRGGEDCIALGSDFDGIETYVESLEHAGKHQNLIDALLNKYERSLVEKIAHKNVRAYLNRI